MTTSRIPESFQHKDWEFTKDTLEGYYNGFQREIWSRSAYERENESVGCVMMFFVLIGETSAISAGLFTDIYLPETIERWEKNGVESLRAHSTGGVVDFHWNFEIPGVEPSEDCTLLSGKCWSISTMTLDEQLLEALGRQGFEGIWHDLHEMLIDQTKVQLESE